MASRPIFVPDYHGPNLVQERSFDFHWHSGFAEVQKKKNISALHDAARRAGFTNVLEISSKSQDKIGRRLSAFSLKISLSDGSHPLESVYQGSKVFENCGPHPEIFDLAPRDAKSFIRELSCGNLVGFELEEDSYPIIPKNAFYDWLYIRSLSDHASWISDNIAYEAFTDIEFNPSRQVNCQARAFAEYLSLLKSQKLERAVMDFGFFSSLLRTI